MKEYESGWTARGNDPQGGAVKRAAAALEVCGKIAESEYILDEFAKSLLDGGYAGSTTAAELVYLGATSRLLDRPVSMAVKADSSAGKSYTLERVLDYFGDNAYYRLSASSEKALIYTMESFRNRILYIPEAEGLGSDQMQSLIRGLISEGRIDYEYTVFNKGLDPRTERVTKEGPTALLVSTTHVRLHFEIETRIFSVPLDDSPEQTRLVLRAIASGKQDKPQDLEEWHWFQRFLAADPKPVVIPYATALADLVAIDSVRMRRDFASLLALIRSHALMHQRSRKIRSGAIVATLDDYAEIHRRVDPILSIAAERSVSPTIRETVDAVRKLASGFDEGEPVTAAQLAKALGINVSSARRRVYQAIPTGYLHNLSSGRNKQMRLLAEELPTEDRSALPTPDELEAAVKGQSRRKQA